MFRETLKPRELLYIKKKYKHIILTTNMSDKYEVPQTLDHWLASVCVFKFPANHVGSMIL